MDTADDLTVVEVPNTFADRVVGARADTLGGEDVDDHNADDAVAAAGSAAKRQVVVAAKTDQTLHP